MYQKFPAGSLRSRLASGAVWTILGAGIGQILSFVATTICARFLGRSTYGEIGMVLATVSSLTSVATIGLGVTITKHVAEFRLVDPARSGRVVSMGLMGTVLAGVTMSSLLLAAAPWVASAALNAPQLGNSLSLGAIILLFSAVSDSQAAIFAGLEEFGRLASLNLIRGVLTIPLVILSSMLWGREAVILSYGIVSGSICVISHSFVRRLCHDRGIPLHWGHSLTEIPLLWRFSLPVWVSGLSFVPAVWCSNVFLANRAGYSQVGLYSAAIQWQAAILLFANAVGSVGLPMLSNVVSEKDARKFKRYLSLNFFLTSSVGAIVALPIALAAPWIMGLYGSSFVEGSWVLVFVCISTFLSIVNIPVGHAIWALNAAKSGMVLSLFRGSVLMIASYLLTGHGAIGLAWANLIMVIAQTLVQAPFVFHLLSQYARNWHDRVAVPINL